MISKITKGAGFAGALKYDQEKAGARVIDHNLSTDIPATQAAEMQAVAAQNRRCSKPVFHASLSAAQGEQLTDEKWRTVAKDYMCGMGFLENQYVVTRHTDRDHDHIHIVANRVRQSDFRVVTERLDHKKTQDVCRQIEQKHGLMHIESGAGRAKPETETGLIASMRKRIDQSVQEAGGDQQQFFNGLEKRGIGVRLNQSLTTGRVSGISYIDTAGGKVFKGSEVSRSWVTVSKQLGQQSGQSMTPGKHGQNANDGGARAALNKATGSKVPTSPRQAIRMVTTAIVKQTAAAMKRGMGVGRQHQAE